jgi:hypothetical protein
MNNDLFEPFASAANQSQLVTRQARAGMLVLFSEAKPLLMTLCSSLPFEKRTDGEEGVALQYRFLFAAAGAPLLLDDEEVSQLHFGHSLALPSKLCNILKLLVEKELIPRSDHGSLPQLMQAVINACEKLEDKSPLALQRHSTGAGG